MMQDTLDTRKGLKNKKKGFEREEWMEGDPNDFTEEQKKQINELNEKIKIFDEEQKRIREELGDNLKKSKLMVDGFVKEFDRKLLDMFGVKCQLDKLVTSYEIYSLKLFKAIYLEENISHKINEYNTLIANLEKV